MTVRRYATPLAFKQALEQRLKSSSTTGADFGRRRQLLVFDRFLARLAQVAGDAVTLKGGLVLELRLARARTTKDVDLRMTGSSREVLDCLQEAGRLDLGDHMRFEIRANDGHPEIRNEGVRYEGFRFRAECRLAGMIYGRPFGVDVAFGDPLIGKPDIVPAPPELWEVPYAAMAAADELPWRTLSQVGEVVSSFLTPVLRSSEVVGWEPSEWKWR